MSFCEQNIARAVSILAFRLTSYINIHTSRRLNELQSIIWKVYHVLVNTGASGEIHMPHIHSKVGLKHLTT